jgi:two-component system sensor histidine kinase KdpD
MIENYEALSPESHLKLLGDIRADAQWLNRMVENLLSVTRIDSSSVRLSKHGVVLEELIDSLLVKFHKHYPSQTVHVSIPEEFIVVPMDPVLIQQVLMNLLENAVFHAAGMKHLWLQVTVSHNQAVFCVEDDGCGIPADRMAHLFTGLLDSEAHTDTGRSNMGIGLSVCRTIIKAHGSDIRAENIPGGGARFRFSLDMEENENV